VTIVQALILGIVQGLTEFLPVSSSGHLVLGKTLLGVPEQGITFEVFVHFGTLLAVVVAFRNDVLNLIRTFFSLFRPVNPQALRERYHKDANLRLLVFIIIATIPAGLIGILFEDKIEQAFNDPHLVCIMLLVTALILSLTFFVKKPAKPLGFINTLLMGIAQSIAILPGISRSGSTISSGLFCKVNGEDAARFSFLLALPAILGATILKAAELGAEGFTGSYLVILAVGTIAAFLSGYLAIKSMLGIVRRGKLYWFAPYCFIVGLVGLLLV